MESRIHQFNATSEILTLNSLEDDLGSLDELLEESKNLFSSAQQAVDNAAATLSALPQKISEHQQVIAQKQSFVQSENSKLDQISLAKNQKVSFIQQVDLIQKQNESQTKLDPQNEPLRQAGAKLSESLALLHKDLQSADAKLLSKQQELVLAKTAVTSAEAALAEIMKMRESAPKVLEEKEKSLLDAQNQMKVREKEFTEFKEGRFTKIKNRVPPSAIPRGITQITFFPHLQFSPFLSRKLDFWYLVGTNIPVTNFITLRSFYPKLVFLFLVFLISSGRKKQIPRVCPSLNWPKETPKTSKIWPPLSNHPLWSLKVLTVTDMKEAAVPGLWYGKME